MALLKSNQYLYEKPSVIDTIGSFANGVAVSGTDSYGSFSLLFYTADLKNFTSTFSIANAVAGSMQGFKDGVITDLSSGWNRTLTNLNYDYIRYCAVGYQAPVYSVTISW